VILDLCWHYTHVFADSFDNSANMLVFDWLLRYNWFALWVIELNFEQHLVLTLGKD